MTDKLTSDRVLMIGIALAVLLSVVSLIVVLTQPKPAVPIMPVVPDYSGDIKAIGDSIQDLRDKITELETQPPPPIVPVLEDVHLVMAEEKEPETTPINKEPQKEWVDEHGVNWVTSDNNYEPGHYENSVDCLNKCHIGANYCDCS